MSSTDCAIEARQLVKTYAVRGKKHGGIRALDGLDLSVPQGVIYGLLGPNGAGKSTTVKILTSLARPDAGSAHVAGIDVLAQPGRVRHMIGVVAQRSGADPTATGRENLMLQGRLYGLRGGSVRARADELLDHFGLAEAAGRLVKTYSGGMQRRLDVALGLMHRPEVLFLDEPTTGLDPESRAAMWQEIARLAGGEGMTVLLTTHYLEEAETLCRNIAIISGGRIVERDRMSSLLRRLHVETFVLNLREPLAVAPPLPGYAATLIDDHTLEVEVSKEENLNGIFARLSALGIEVLSMRNKVNRLEEIFMQLVEGGRTPAAEGARHGGASPAPARTDRARVEETH